MASVGGDDGTVLVDDTGPAGAAQGLQDPAGPGRAGGRGGPAGAAGGGGGGLASSGRAAGRVATRGAGSPRASRKPYGDQRVRPPDSPSGRRPAGSWSGESASTTSGRTLPAARASSVSAAPAPPSAS